MSRDLSNAMAPLIGEHVDIKFAKFTPAEDISTAILRTQAEHTSIDISSGFPFAQTPENALFSSLPDRVDDSLAIAQHERTIWQLCAILFDPLNDACQQYLEGVPEDQVEHYAPRMRLDALGDLWSELVTASVQDGLKRARTDEEKALLYLTQNNIDAACDALVKGKSFKLATLVSQLPGTPQGREMMQRQLEAWRQRNDWSEMSEAVRALYSILAGELYIVEGKKAPKIAPEDRVVDFNIANTFQLDWKQSFALTLFFGGHQSIGDVVQAYSSHLLTGQDGIQPNTTWPNGVKTDDILFELLRLQTGEQNTSKLFNPLAVSGSAINSRLTWQLATLLCAAGRCDLTGKDLDQITYEYANEFENAGMLPSSCWVLLHVNDSNTRKDAISSLLNRHGDKISAPSNDTRGSFEELTQDNQVPAATVWRAKALYAKGALRDPGLQTEWLLRAGDIDFAHEVLCATVGPQAVVEQDHERLSNLLRHFGGRKVHSWQQGGQVFGDYIKLVRSQKSKRQSADEDAAVRRLRKGLAAMENDGMTKKSLEERVAIIEMGRVLHDFEEGERDQEMLGMEQSSGGRGFETDMWLKYQRAMGSMA